MDCLGEEPVIVPKTVLVVAEVAAAAAVAVALVVCFVCVCLCYTFWNQTAVRGLIESGVKQHIFCCFCSQG